MTDQKNNPLIEVELQKARDFVNSIISGYSLHCDDDMYLVKLQWDLILENLKERKIISYQKETAMKRMVEYVDK